MLDDPRQWKVVIDGRRLTSFEELINLLHEAGFKVVKPAEKAVLDCAHDLPEYVLDSIRELPERRAQDFVAAVVNWLKPNRPKEKTNG